jgi:hypothetical protein
MRIIAAWGLGAALLAGLGTATSKAADDVDGSRTRSSAWAPTWQWKPFSASTSSNEDTKPVEKKPAPKSEPTARKPATPGKPARVVDEAAAGRSREEAALLRRLQACDKLKDIAIRTDDKDLLRRAEKLEERAQAAYTRRVGRSQDGVDRFEADDKTIDRFLGAGKGGAKEAASYTVSGTDHSNRAAAKEVKP